MDKYVVKRPPGETGGGGGGKRPRAEEPASGQSPWQEIRAEGLSCDYRLLFGKAEADEIFQQLEEEVEYFEGDMTKLHVFAMDPSSQSYQRPHHFGHRTYF
ncbi:DNA oxidative demethylase ALKBH2 isoform X3 [Aquila chrysaetos chrysaetos]|uniref:DNA oxidative demethylase ALKBH2 isoform X3 n=1 Tax=Aquila chrysaetos chrysaetos TaxID=223781 RepID=UPI0005D097F3|nr:DNA oxidative demethylase ALKBH2 isoform X3 [Aquila chrysaetos chrysaetos]